jgi:predicted transcriptional regulator
MDTQNITVALPRTLLRKVKHLAVEKETSVSALLKSALEDLVRDQDAYAKARDAHREILKRPFNLGTHGRITWSRDSLHERR